MCADFTRGIAAKGRHARGRSDNSYKFGDFTRGLFASPDTTSKASSNTAQGREQERGTLAEPPYTTAPEKHDEDYSSTLPTDHWGSQGIPPRCACKIVPFNAKLPRTESDAKILVEIGLMQRVNHPNLVRLHEVYAYGGFAYIIMDLVESDVGGHSLQSYLETNGPLQTDRELATVTHRLASALEHLQGQCHLLHRDVKPANVTRPAALRWT